MSVRAMSWAFDQAIPPGPKIVLLAVADRTWDRDGHWVVDWPELEAKCSLSRRAIRRYLNQLEENGLVTMAERYDAHSGMQLTNLCVLHLTRSIDTPAGWGEGTISGHPPNGVQGTNDGHPGGPTMATPGDRPRPPGDTNGGHPLNLNSSSSLIPKTVPETFKTDVSGVPPDDPRGLWITAEGILEFLNRKTGRHYQPRKPNKDPTASLKAVHGLLKVGYSEQELRQVIGNRLVKWGDDPKMQEFLRPETLFRPSKFEQYLGEVGAT